MPKAIQKNMKKAVQSCRTPVGNGRNETVEMDGT